MSTHEMDNTADHDAIVILHTAYLQVSGEGRAEFPASDLLYDARQYLRDRAAYARQIRMVTQRQELRTPTDFSGPWE